MANPDGIGVDREAGIGNRVVSPSTQPRSLDRERDQYDRLGRPDGRNSCGRAARRADRGRP